jgi:hypothetical protein
MGTISLLISTKKQTELFFDFPEDALKNTFIDNGWSIKQALLHIADVESLILDRIKKVISESDQVVWPMDQELWCKKLDYNNFPIELSKATYSANRESVIYLAQNFYNTLGNSSLIYDATGSRTLREEFDNLANYNQDFLSKIRSQFKLLLKAA